MSSYETINKLSIKIKEELMKFFQSSPAVFNKENIELFIKIIQLPIESASIRIEGLQTRMLNALNKILIEDLSKDDIIPYFTDLAKIEPFLKKVLFLVDETIFYQISNSRAGLAKCIDSLNLNPRNIRLDSTNIDSIQESNDFMLHILRSYQLRNIESHVCVLWSKKELYENIESLLVTYIYTIYLHKTILNSKASTAIDWTPYLNNVVREFENWQKRFVHIMGQERFEEISITAIETENWSNTEGSILREGSIYELRENIEEMTMVVLGEPGMGKSTTLQYLSYNDAKALLDFGGAIDKLRIPIYCELKLLSKDDSIISILAKKIKISEDQLIELFINGHVNLYLDGLNEVLSDIRKTIRIDIQNLIITYPNIFIIITSRPLAYYNEFKTTPVFTLQKMVDAQISEFLTKNCDNHNTEILIKTEILQNTRLSKIIRVPLLLKMLISVVNTLGVLPDNKTKIIKKFIQNLYKRETEKHMGIIDLRIVNRLLCYLGQKTRDMKGSNVGWKIEEMESIIEKRIESSNFSLTVFQFIDMSVDLNILVRDDDKYSFIHELYQEYFASEELYRSKFK